MLQNVPPIRLVALDLDGTLLNHEGKVTSRTRAALQAAADRGVAIVPTTGRPLGNLPPVVAQLPGIRYAITSNGAAVWDLGDDPLAAVYSRYSNAAQRRTAEPVCLLHRLMPVETAREAFAMFMEYEGGMGVFCNGYSVKDQAGVDFQAERPRIDARIVCTIRIGQIVIIALAFGAGFLKQKMHAKQARAARAKTAPATQERKVSNG